MKAQILIVGHGRSGKDTAGEILESLTGLKYGGTASLYLCEHVRAEHFPDQSWQDVYDARHEHRQLWYDEGNFLREVDPGRLLRDCFEQGQIAAGIRDYSEIQLACEEHLITHLIWVESDVPPDPTVMFTLGQCRALCQAQNILLDVLYNSRDEGFQLELKQWARKHKLLPQTQARYTSHGDTIATRMQGVLTARHIE